MLVILSINQGDKTQKVKTPPCSEPVYCEGVRWGNISSAIISVNPANTGQISHDEINKTFQGITYKKETKLDSWYAQAWLLDT